MKRKTIAKVLRKKFLDWTSTIEDQELQNLVKRNSIITGGAIASLITNEPVNDFDVYFRNMETAEGVARYYVKKFSEEKGGKHPEYDVRIGPGTPKFEGQMGASHKKLYDKDRVWIYVDSNGVAGDPQPGYTGETLGEDFIEIIDEPSLATLASEAADRMPKYRPIFLSSNAITLSDKMQLIIRFHGEAKDIHKNYDFVHCTNWWDSKTNKVTLHAEALEALLTKELIYVGSKYPVCSIIRTRKFIRRGWSITAGQILKMIMQCNDLDLYDIDVLEDQLVGVDSAYFMQVISMIKRDSAEINSAYICEIIDRIF